ncbi:hypothetical protein C0993_004273 [Termitomyces sp. T159_Od127]|nr:hypothetical protein C0993_004273 [Termitomyces sp. T159_Od127]
MFVKFGDGNEAARHDAYSTHNPSFGFKYRSSTVKQEGRKMEIMTLDKLNQGHTVDKVRNHKGGETEWYKVNLGRNHAAAVASKRAIRLKMEDYRTYQDAELYATEYIALVEQHVPH